MTRHQLKLELLLLAWCAGLSPSETMALLTKHEFIAVLREVETSFDHHSRHAKLHDGAHDAPGLPTNIPARWMPPA